MRGPNWGSKSDTSHMLSSMGKTLGTCKGKKCGTMLGNRHTDTLITLLRCASGATVTISLTSWQILLLWPFVWNGGHRSGLTIVESAGRL